MADATALGATLGAGAVVGFDADSFADSAGGLTAVGLTAGVLMGGVGLVGNGLAVDPLDFDSLGSSTGLGLDL